MRSRLVLLMALAIAAAAVAVTITRVASSFPSPSRPPVALASLPPSLASYLGVYEKGPPRSYQPVANFASRGGQAAEPRRVLQRLGGALRGTVRRECPRFMALSRSCRSIPPTPLFQRSLRVPMTATCAHMPTVSGISATQSSSASGTR